MAVEQILELASAGSVEEVEAAFHQAVSMDIFEKMFPGFSRLAGCEQNLSHHMEGNCLIHVGKVFAYAAQDSTLSESECRVLLVAALVHDHCKPDTYAVEESGKITFYQHAEMAAKLCPEFGRNVGLSTEETEALAWVVGEHMHAYNIPSFADKKRQAYYQSPWFTILVSLQEADARGSWKNADGSEHGEVRREFFEKDRPELLAKLVRVEEEKSLRARVSDALNAAGISPGPYFGQAGKEAVAAMAVEDFSTDENVTMWVKAYVEANPPS